MLDETANNYQGYQKDRRRCKYLSIHVFEKLESRDFVRYLYPPTKNRHR